MNQKIIERIDLLFWVGNFFLFGVSALQWLAFAMTTYAIFPAANALSIPIFLAVFAFYVLCWSVVCDLMKVPFRIEAQNEEIKEHLESLRLRG